MQNYNLNNNILKYFCSRFPILLVYSDRYEIKLPIGINLPV